MGFMVYHSRWIARYNNIDEDGEEERYDGYELEESVTMSTIDPVLPEPMMMEDVSVVDLTTAPHDDPKNELPPGIPTPAPPPTLMEKDRTPFFASLHARHQLSRDCGTRQKRSDLSLSLSLSCLRHARTKLNRGIRARIPLRRRRRSRRTCHTRRQLLSA